MAYLTQQSELFSGFLQSGNVSGAGYTTVFYNGVNFIISGAGSPGGGEVNTASNIGGAVGVWYDKNVYDLRFNTISGGTGIQVKLNGNVIYVDSNINTGQFYAVSNLQGYTRSGDVSAVYATIINLGTTGSTLDSKINSLSGYSNSTFYLASNPNGYLNTLSGLSTGYVQNVSGAIDTRLQSTGSTLDGKINSLSGYSNNTFYLATNPNGYLNTLSGLSTGYVQNTSGALDIRLQSTGSTLDSKINSLSGYSNSVFATVTNLASTGQQAWTAANVNGINLSGNLQTTGSTLDSKINSLSGYSNNTFATSSNVSSTYATILNLASTGSTLDGKINSLSGYSNNTFATITNLASTGQQAWTAANSNSINISGNLQSTGSTLDGRINSLSGYSNNTFATITNLTQTGVTLGSKIDSLSGYSNGVFATITNLASTGQQAWNSANNNGINLSGNLQTTGSNLNNRIDSLSGYSNNNFYLKTNPDGYAQSGNFISGVSISGGLAIRGALNINAGSNITLTQFGNNSFTIASTASGPAAGGGVTGISITGGSSMTGGLRLLAGSNITLIRAGDFDVTVNSIDLDPANQITGSGANYYIPVFTLNSSGIINSNIISSGGFLGINSNINPNSELMFSGELRINKVGDYDLLVVSGDYPYYTQINVKNINTGISGSSDLVCTADYGTESDGYSNLGINSSQHRMTGLGYVGSTGDAYCLALANDFFIGNSKPTRNLYLFAGSNPTGEAGTMVKITSTQMSVSGNIFTPSGRLASINEIPSSQFILTGNNSGNVLILNDTPGEPNITALNAMEVFSKQIANNDILYIKGDWGRAYGLSPTFYNKQIQMHLPASSTTQTVIGNGAGANLGTLSHVPDQFYGYMTNYVTAATANSQAGTSFNIANLYKGNISGINGFFLASRFALTDATGTYATTGVSGATTGLRFFYGATDQALATMVNTTSNPAGNYAGFHFCRSTGTVTRVDTNFQFAWKNNTTQVVQDCGMVFDSGLYEGYIFMPPYPNTGSIYWQLSKVNNNLTMTTVSGVTTGDANLLPAANTAMRAGIAIQNMTTAAKNIRTAILYSEV